MNGTDGPIRLRRLRILIFLAAAALFTKVFLSILVEYRFYFPANFDAVFLIGRREYFHGPYRIAFYAHIISAPLALAGASFLMLSGGRSRYVGIHRWTGRVNSLMVLVLVVPSGLFMAFYAVAGPIAGVGLGTLSMATAVCLVLAVQNARARRFQAHQRWACRTFILLSSPLLLRVLSGAATLSQLDSNWFYRLNAWVSWLCPLIIYEAWWRSNRYNRRRTLSP